MGMIWVGYRRDEDEARAILADEERIDELLESDNDRSVDLDKAWHGIHWLLTGSEWSTQGPLAQVILGGEELGEDIGYGPGRLLPASEVADVADALDALDLATLGERFDAAAMSAASIYPDVWRSEPAAELVEWLVGEVKDLRTFYRTAADRGEAVIQTVC